MAIDISCFVEPAEFKKTAGEIMRQLRASTKAEGQQHIYTAGEKEYLTYLERSKNGVPLDPAIRKTLQSARDEYNVDFVFSWET